MGVIIALFALGFAVPVIIPLAQTLLVLLIAVLCAEVIVLFRFKTPVEFIRKTGKVMSLGSDNSIKIEIENKLNIPLKTKLIDELPAQFQDRNFMLHLHLAPNEKRTFNYTLKPLTRGEYCFGKVHVFIQSLIGLAERRVSNDGHLTLPVYPSIIQMKQFELMAITKISTFQGVKKMRRLGQSYEFEQIKNYVQGDDYRSINWKATGRKGELMVNKFVDERAQQIYSIIDNSRAMHMPFDGLSLLDYAINSSLVISNTALYKQDKAGLFIFSDKIETIIKAENGKEQKNRLMQGLYKLKEKPLEANYELFYLSVRNAIKGRSLLILYTNFESFYALQRVLPILRKLNKLHLLLVVFFENTEIVEFSSRDTKNIQDIYLQTIARIVVSEKTQMAQTLNQYGIQTILTKPQDLSVNTLNKYLELKARGMI
jgi:uncharacterized protein (DUF58 family)